MAGKGPTPDFDQVTLKWAGVDLDGTPTSGRLELTYNASTPLLDDDSVLPISIYPTLLTKTLTTTTVTVGGASKTAGYAEFSVPASDDPDIQGSGGTYTVIERLDNGKGVTRVFVASKDAGGGVIWLNRLTSVAPIAGEIVSAVSVAEFTALKNQVAGIVVGSGSGPVTWASVTGKPTFATVATSGSYADLSSKPTIPTVPATLPPTDGTVTDAKVASGAAIAASKLGTGTAAAGKYLDGAGAWTTLPTASGSGAALLSTAATVTANATLAFDTVTPVDATGAARTMTLPTPTKAGQIVVVEKTDASTNTVTISGTIRGSATTLTLSWQFESIELVAESLTSWRPIAGHKTKTALDAAYGTVTDAKVATGAAISVSKLGTGTPASGKYLDGAGAWTALPTSVGGTYTDEQAQDAAALALTSGTHSGISFAYDDPNGKINATVTAAAGTSSSSTSSPAVDRFHIALAARSSTPVLVASVGDSNAFGSGAVGPTTWHVRLSDYLHAAYPLDSGAASPAYVNYLGFSPENGVRVVNVGGPGATSGNYFDTSTRDSLIAMGVQLYIHVIGSNDHTQQIPLATFKANILQRIDYVDSRSTRPTSHLLVHMHNPTSNNPINWASYGQTMATIASERSTNVAYFDLAAVFASIGYPTADPYGFISDLHLTDAGQALFADYLRRALNVPGAASAIVYPAVSGGGGTTPTAPGQVTGLTATPGSGSAALSWTAPANGGAALTDYKVEYQPSGGSWTVFADGTSTAVTATVTGLTNGTVYAFRVSAINSVGTGTASATATATPAAATASTAPGTPTAVTATPGAASATIAWTAPASNGGSAITGYRVRTYTAGSVTGTVTIGVVTSTTISGLTNGTAYTFDVSAINAIGTGTASAQTSAVTPAAATGSSGETWTGANGAAWPTGWTANGLTATIQNNQGRATPQGQFGSWEYNSGATGKTGDFDLRVDAKVSVDSQALNIGMASAAPTSGIRPPEGYMIQTGFDANGVTSNYSLGKPLSNDAGNTPAYFFGSVTQSATGCSYRLKRTGALVQVKVWPQGTTEPSAWGIEYTDPAPITTALKPLLVLSYGLGVVDFDNLVVSPLA